MSNNNLYVITTVFNPEGYESRYKLYREFKKYIEESGAILYTIELATGNQNFMITEKDNHKDIQLRTDSIIWYKENLLNILLNRLPYDAEYIANIDADILFFNKNLQI